MLKIFKTVWKDEKRILNIGTKLILSEEELNLKEEVFNFKIFEDAYDFFCKHFYINFYFPTYSLFNKPIIQTIGKNITAKNFEPFKIIKTYREVTDEMTIKELAEDLKADEFCKFLKDRQINFNLDLTK